MKKTIATILGLALMTSTALAANPTIGTTSVISPGSEIDITINQFKSDATGYLTVENYSISQKKISKGSKLIKEFKIDNDDEVVRIVLNKDMELAEPRTENLVIDTLSIKSKKENGNIKRGEVLTIHDIREKVGHVIHNLELQDSGTLELQEGYNKIITDDRTIAYGDVFFSSGDLMLEGRAYKDDKIFVKGSQKANTTVLKQYPDADLRFMSLETNGLPTSYKVLLAAEEDEYVYKISETGKLVASGLTWNEDDYSWSGKVRSSVDYVISDVRLTIAAAGTEVDEEGVENPATGANDVVGIAAALAVVSLVAAGAVSLKK